VKQRGQQFEEHTFENVGPNRETYKADIPPVTEGHQRLWRSSNIAKPEGWWSNKPLTGYGSQLMYMDLPHTEAERHRLRGSWPPKEGPPDPRQTHEYLIPQRPETKMPGHVNHVQFRS
jgi:hypothetical protein